jgi:hypothetical protein
MGTVSGVGGPQTPYPPQGGSELDVFKQVVARFIDHPNSDDYQELGS